VDDVSLDIERRDAGLVGEWARKAAGKVDSGFIELRVARFALAAMIAGAMVRVGGIGGHADYFSGSFRFVDAISRGE